MSSISELHQILGELSFPREVQSESVPAKKERKCRIKFIEEVTNKSNNTVIFENGSFFVELLPASILVRPKVTKRYLKKVRKTEREMIIEKSPIPILIPFTSENPLKWFKDNVYSIKGQKRLISGVWKYRDEIFPKVMLG